MCNLVLHCGELLGHSSRNASDIFDEVEDLVDSLPDSSKDWVFFGFSSLIVGVEKL